MQAVLGLGFDTEAERIYFRNPRLPEFLDRVEISNIRVGSGVVDVSLVRNGEDVAVNVRHRTAGVEVVATHGTPSPKSNGAEPEPG